MLFEKYCQPRAAGIILSERFFTLSDFFLCGLRFATFFHEDWHHDDCHFCDKCENLFQAENKTVGKQSKVSISDNPIPENLHRENTRKKMQ